MLGLCFSAGPILTDAEFASLSSESKMGVPRSTSLNECMHTMFSRQVADMLAGWSVFFHLHVVA